MADIESTATHPAGAAIDLTPNMVSNWDVGKPQRCAVLTVNREATLHDRAALAWVLTGELIVIADATLQNGGGTVSTCVMSLMSDRLEAIERLLSDVGYRTAALEKEATHD